jgi:hypothetical protein
VRQQFPRCLAAGRLPLSCCASPRAHDAGQIELVGSDMIEASTARRAKKKRARPGFKDRVSNPQLDAGRCAALRVDIRAPAKRVLPAGTRTWSSSSGREARLGLGRIVALYCRSSTSY